MRLKPVCRKLIALFLLFAMLLPLSACSFRSGESGPAPSAQGASETAAPTPEPTPEPTPYVVPADLPLRISEVMASNKATLACGNEFPDWVELQNVGSEPLRLTDVLLCCGTDSYALGDGELGAGRDLTQGRAGKAAGVQELERPHFDGARRIDDERAEVFVHPSTSRR